MANKNNNTESLAAAIDDEPTAELEALSESSAVSDAAPVARETEEHTCSFDDSDDVDDIPVSRLRSDLRTRNESIHKLQYDIEQLRARWTGLEKEIKAREKISDDLNDELCKLRRQLSDEQRLRAEQDRTHAELRDQLAARNTELEKTVAELGSMRDSASTGAARIAILEMRQSSDATAMQILEDDLQRLRDQLDSKPQAQEDESAFRALEGKLTQTRTALADLTQYVEGRQDAWHEQQAESSTKDRLLAEQALQIEALSTGPAAGAERGSGQPEAPYDVTVSDRQSEIAELQAQIQRTETYADSLRQQLQDARQNAERQGADHTQLQQALDNALEQIRDLRTQLEDERLTKADLERQMNDMQRRYDSEILELRGELNDAKTVIEEQYETNQLLRADLVKSNDSGTAVRARLERTEERFSDQRNDLKKQISQQRQQIEEQNHKLESKDRAISALLNELAAKSSTIESLDEIGHAVHDLDDRMLASFDERDAEDRERSTRLLVGTIDGQKLRFPLFKERLTIGRAADNDIQLKTQCISRQHAVISSDRNGCRITDQGSKNGVYVNGTRTTDAALVNGDKLVIGTASLTFEERVKR